MRKPRLTESQIVAILMEGKAGVPVAGLLRKYGISRATRFQWKTKYGVASGVDLVKLKVLEAENARLMRLDAGMTPENGTIKDVLHRNP